MGGLAQRAGVVHPASAICFGIYKHGEDVMCDARATWCGSFRMSNAFIRAVERYQKAQLEGKSETSLGGRCIQRARREVLLEETRPSQGNIKSSLL